MESKNARLAAVVVPLIVGVLLAGLIGMGAVAVVALKLLRGGAADDIRGAGAPPPTATPLDTPDRVIELSFQPRHLASSGNFICVQDPMNDRLSVFNWRSLDDKGSHVPVLLTDRSVVVGDGSVLSAPYFERWPEGKPLSAEDERDRERQLAVLNAEPYLRSFEKVKGNLIYLRRADRAEAEIVSNIGNGWYVHTMRAAQGGQGAGICLIEDYVVTRSSPFRKKLRLGAYRDADRAISWVDGLRTDEANDHFPCVNAAAISNDAARVAVIGSDGQGGWVACVDAVTQKVLWDKRQDRNADTAAFQDGGFSPDGKVFYAGGTHGELYAYEAETGKYLSVCKVGDRIERVVTSPDSKMVAAGLANADGTVCLIDAAASKVIRKITTGLNVIRGTGFSPDSTMLAVAGAGSRQIRIYRVGTQPEQ